jgi:integrase
MDLAYLSGQRPADVLKFSQYDIQDDILIVRQTKTKKFLRILPTTEHGRTELGLLIDQIRSRKVASVFMLTTERSQELTQGMLRLRFVAARAKAIAEANQTDRVDLAGRIAAFQFRDARAKATSNIGDLKQASRLLGLSDVAITQDVHQRVGKKVNPTR